MHVFAIQRFSLREGATAGAQLLRRYGVVALTFVVGLTLSFVAFSLARDWEGRRIQADFTRLAGERTISIENGLRNLLDPLLSIRGFYAASNSVERDEFTTFINAQFSSYAGLQAFWWVPHVFDAEREQYEENARHDGYLDFQINEQTRQGERVRAPQHAQYFPVYYVEPTTRNTNILGLNLATDPTWRKALDEARDTGAAVTLGRSAPGQEGDGRSRIFMVLPIYRNGKPKNTVQERQQHFQGVLVGIFQLDMVVENALTLFARSPGGVDILLHDDTTAPNERLQYARASRTRGGALYQSKTEAELLTGMHSLRTFAAIGRQWTTLCVPAPQFFTLRPMWQPWGALAVGLLCTGILTVYLLDRQRAEEALQKAHEELEKRVQERTAELAQANQALQVEIAERNRTEGVLRESEERYRALIENTFDAVCEITQDGQYVYLSPNHHDIIGYEPKELRQRNAFALIHPEDLPMVLSVFRHLPGQAAFRFRHKNGEWRWLESTGRAYDTAQGEFRAVLVSRDITERKRVEEALHLKDRAMASTSEGICITDPHQSDNPIIYVNSGFEHLTGYSSAEVLGRNCRFLQGSETDHDTLVKIRTAIREGRECSVELLNYRKDGTPFWNRFSITPVRDATEQVTHFIGVQSDITERKEIERLKNELVSTVSHELRTPLTSLRGFAELLLKRNFPPQKQHEFITIIHNEAVRLTELINDFLDLQRMESGRQTYDFADIELAPLLREAAAVFTREDGLHTLQVEVPPSLPSVRADADRIRQVLTNLLSNAIKYSPQGCKVALDVRPREAMLVVSVADQGIGLTADSMKKLFTKFYRVNNEETRRIGGSGLGLSLVKGIVEAHGGQVWVESELGKGSTFFFSLPMTQPPPAAAPAPEITPDAETDILLIEDDHAYTSLLQEHF